MDFVDHFWDSAPPMDDDLFCDCPGGSPPQFVIPPPPPPPSLSPCYSEMLDLQFCNLEPFGSQYAQTQFPSLPIIGILSFAVVILSLVISYLVWRNKKKVQNLPCKNNPPSHCDLPVTNMLNYDPNASQAHTFTPIELLDVKYGGSGRYNTGTMALTGDPSNPCFSSQNMNDFNPIYEEVSEGSKPSVQNYTVDSENVQQPSFTSEDELTQDELNFALRQARSRSTNVLESCGINNSQINPMDGFRTEKLQKNRFSPNGSQKHTHSLERNKDSHISDSFRAKQNYYMSKTMLGPDLSENVQAKTLGNSGHRSSHHKLGSGHFKPSHGKSRSDLSRHRRDNINSNDSVMYHSNMQAETHPYYSCDPDLVQQAFYEPMPSMGKQFKSMDHHSKRNHSGPIFALVAKNNPYHHTLNQAPVHQFYTSSPAPSQSPLLTFQPRLGQRSRGMLPLPRHQQSMENVYSTIDDGAEEEEEDDDEVIKPSPLANKNFVLPHKSFMIIKDDPSGSIDTDVSSENYGDLRPSYDPSLCA